MRGVNVAGFSLKNENNWVFVMLFIVFVFLIVRYLMTTRTSMTHCYLSPTIADSVTAPIVTRHHKKVVTCRLITTTAVICECFTFSRYDITSM